MQRVTNSPWLSWGLLVLAYATFGRLLYTTDASHAVWASTVALMVAKAGILTLLWTPVRKFVLLGFQSDVGYSIMVLALASLAVVAVVQIRTFAYIVVLIATAILARVDCRLKDMSSAVSFLVLVSLPAIGLALGWVPKLFPGT